MADDKDQAKSREAAIEHGRDLVKQGAEQKKKIVEENNERQDWKPTPTQEENDLAKVGVPVEQHEEDGSGPEPNPLGSTKTRQVEPSRPQSGGYATRGSGASGSQSPSPKPPQS